MKDVIINLWNDINQQKWSALSSYFKYNAIIHWHNTNECFCVSDFIRANSEYPGKWIIQIERLVEAGNVIISVVKVSCEETSFHATSFFTFDNDKISILDEYWGDDGSAPQWRIDMGIGKPLKPVL